MLPPLHGVESRSGNAGGFPQSIEPGTDTDEVGGTEAVLVLEAGVVGHGQTCIRHAAGHQLDEFRVEHAGQDPIGRPHGREVRGNRDFVYPAVRGLGSPLERFHVVMAATVGEQVEVGNPTAVERSDAVREEAVEFFPAVAFGQRAVHVIVENRCGKLAIVEELADGGLEESGGIGEHLADTGDLRTTLDEIDGQQRRQHAAGLECRIHVFAVLGVEQVVIIVPEQVHDVGLAVTQVVVRFAVPAIADEVVVDPLRNHRNDRGLHEGTGDDLGDDEDRTLCVTALGSGTLCDHELGVTGYGADVGTFLRVVRILNTQNEAGVVVQGNPVGAVVGDELGQLVGIDDRSSDQSVPGLGGDGTIGIFEQLAEDLVDERNHPVRTLVAVLVDEDDLTHLVVGVQRVVVVPLEHFVEVASEGRLGIVVAGRHRATLTEDEQYDLQQLRVGNGIGASQFHDVEVDVVDTRYDDLTGPGLVGELGTVFTKGGNVVFSGGAEYPVGCPAVVRIKDADSTPFACPGGVACGTTGAGGGLRRSGSLGGASGGLFTFGCHAIFLLVV